MTSISNTTDPLLARRFSTDEEIPEVRSIVRIRLPKPLFGPGSLLSGSDVSGATRGTYHSAIVRYSIPDYARRCIVVSVWPVTTYSAAVARYSSGATWMRDQPEDFRDANIPFPSDQDTRDPRHPPSGFGEPITISQYSARRPSWILMESQTLDLAFTTAWKRFDPNVRISVADMIRIQSYSIALASRHSSLAQVSLTVLPQPSTIEPSLFVRMFGSAPPLRLGSDAASDGDYNDNDRDEDAGDGFGFVRLMAPRSELLSDALERHQRDAAGERDEIVMRWIADST